MCDDNKQRCKFKLTEEPRLRFKVKGFLRPILRFLMQRVTISSEFSTNQVYCTSSENSILLPRSKQDLITLIQPKFLRSLIPFPARWGVAEWIERPILMLEVRGLNLQKIPLLYPETLEVPIRGQVQLRILELGDEAGENKKN